jgi:DNA-binding CsgD family transcriptional regulator/tetratricopeptide (TPR) repeat protein
MIDFMAERLSSPVFVGRVAEITRLGAALERAVAGEPSTVMVAGEAGVGKTRLLAELIGQARGAGAVTLVGGCLDVGDGVLAYAPVVEAARSLAGMLDAEELERVLGASRAELARLIPELGEPVTGADPVAPARLFELLLGVLHRLAERRPLLLVIEDLHWADQSTRDLLGFLIRNIRTGICMVLTYRSDDLHRRHPLRPFLAELGRNSRAERLDLGAFGRREVADLLAGITGERPSSRTVTEVRARSGGNPFFVEELLAASREGTALPTAVRDVVLARVEALSEPAQRVLQVAAVAGSRVDHELLAAVSAQPVAQLVGVLREAVAHHVLSAETGSQSYAFRHALVQEAIYDDLLPVERGPLHAAYARALSDRIDRRAGSATAAELGQLAYHWYAAHDLGAALLSCVRAGQAAEATYALAEALQHYERALELWVQVPQAAAQSPLDRVTVLQRAAQAAFLIGEHDRSIALAEIALEGTDAGREPLRAGALLERLARYHWAAGDSVRALETIERAVSAVPARPPSRERARALAARGQMLMLMDRHAQARACCEEAIALARQVKARAVEGNALTSLASSLSCMGELDVAGAYFEEAFRIAEEVGNTDEICRARGNHGYALWAYGRWEEAAEISVEAYRLTIRFGLTRTYGLSMLADGVESLIFLGRGAEALAILEEEFPDLDQPTGFIAATPLLARALHLLHRGDLAAAEADLAAVLKSTPFSLDPQYAGPQFSRMAAVAVWDGRLDAARQAVADGLRLLADSDDGSLIIEICQAGLTAEAAIAEQALARRASRELVETRAIGRDLLDRATAAADQASRLPLVEARLMSAEAEWTRVEGASDPERWAAALAAWQGLKCPFEIGYARWRRGEALLSAGAPREVVAADLVQGWTVARDLGARLLAEEIGALARRARIDLTHPDDAPEPNGQSAEPGDRFGLTPRERDVLKLVATGRTNRQIAQALFISDKTASVHVSNILAKLGAANRSEAAAISHRLGLG